jgi:hypothetical protein
MKKKVSIVSVFGIIALLAIGFGLGFWIFNPKPDKEPEYLTKEYIKFNGFKPLKGSPALVMQYIELMKYSYSDTLKATMAILPDKKGNTEFFVLGFTVGNNFTPVDILYTREEFDRWTEFLYLSNPK